MDTLRLSALAALVQMSISEVSNSNVGEVCDDYTCSLCRKQFNRRYPSRRPVANMVEAVYCICHHCNQLGHVRKECQIKKAELEVQGLYVDQVNEEKTKISSENICTTS